MLLDPINADPAMSLFYQYNTS